MNGDSSNDGPRRDNLAGTLHRNIAALVEHRRSELGRARMQDRVADAITAFAGSMRFVLLHAAVYGFWIAANLGWVPAVPAWDPTMVVLAMVASVEAIFLSTFVLISQNRLAAAEDRRAELNLQISLLAEHEVTKLVGMTADIAERLGVAVRHREIDELKADVDPQAVLQAIEAEDRDQ